MFNEQSHFFDLEAAKIKPILVMNFGPIALLFAPSPFYPLHASQVGPQKTPQICVLLLQVVSLGDFSDVSDIILMTSWCFQHHVGGILMYPTSFWFNFPLSNPFFSWILWNCAPRWSRKHNSEYSHKAFLIKNINFWTSQRPKSSPFWCWFSALSLCCSFLSPFIPSMPPKLDLKKPCK